MSNAIQLRDNAMELFRAARFEDAAASFGQAHQAYVAQGDWAAAAKSLNDQGVCLRQSAQFEESERVLLEARAIFQKIGDVCGEAQAVGNLGALCESRHQDAQAIELYRETTALLEKCDEPNLSRDTWLALGRLRLRRREWLPALAAYDMGLSSATHLNASQRALRILLKMTRRLILRS
jgi:tetratricopeptide (TPR) repeat protein